MTPPSLLPLVLRFREFHAQYGPFSPISEQAARELEPTLVWTLTEDGSDLGNTVLMNGFQESDSVFQYQTSIVPWTGAPSSIQMVEVIWIECPECEAGAVSDPDDCAECQGNGCLSIDIEELAVNGPSEMSEREIWMSRRPG